MRKPLLGQSCKTKSYLAAGIMVQDLEQAEVEILKIVRDAFDKEVKTLKESHAQTEGARKDRQCAKEKKALLKKTGSLHTLDPYLDATGVLRVGGRITKADLTDSLKNPLSYQKLVTELIIRHIHEKTHHSGRGVTLNELCSNGYWIINGNAAVRRFISRCVRCPYLRGTASQICVWNPHHHFHIAQCTVSGHGTLRQAGERSKGTEPYSLVWPVVRYTLKLYTPWKQIRSCKYCGTLSLKED